MQQLFDLGDAKCGSSACGREVVTALMGEQIAATALLELHVPILSFSLEVQLFYLNLRALAGKDKCTFTVLTCIRHLR